MKERPILMSGPMVRAILDGRKTQTRRIVKPQPPANVTRVTMVPNTASGKATMVWCQDGPIDPLNGWNYKERHPNGWQCPYGMLGDRLWVRESWHQRGKFVFALPDSDKRSWLGTREIAYSADAKRPGHDWRSRPSIHMPRWASRITLEITSVRVERLQDISEEDAKAEGAPFELGELERLILGAKAKYRSGFCRLWESINGPGSWASNPWVWVVEFKASSR